MAEGLWCGGGDGGGA